MSTASVDLDRLRSRRFTVRRTTFTLSKSVTARCVRLWLQRVMLRFIIPICPHGIGNSKTDNLGCRFTCSKPMFAIPITAAPRWIGTSNTSGCSDGDTLLRDLWPGAVRARRFTSQEINSTNTITDAIITREWFFSIIHGLAAEIQTGDVFTGRRTSFQLQHRYRTPGTTVNDLHGHDLARPRHGHRRFP